MKVQHSFGSLHRPLLMKGWQSLTRKDVRQKRGKKQQQLYFLIDK